IRERVIAAGMTPMAASRTFARRAEEVPFARQFIRDILADHPASFDAELLTCELVTNAVQHATGAAGVTVAVRRRGSVVHVDVIDDGRAGLPLWREASGHDEDGRGFQLVNEIANRWGFLREHAGTCVWFEISPLTGRPQLAAADRLARDAETVCVLRHHQRRGAGRDRVGV
ncbi:MAG: ATP-binding protein, partial [Streptosporangiaceae bacterium]